jgi:hypothetical protein
MGFISVEECEEKRCEDVAALVEEWFDKIDDVRVDCRKMKIRMDSRHCLEMSEYPCTECSTRKFLEENGL